MTFDEAIQEMKVLAGGDDWSFQYEAASYFLGPHIHGYIARPGVGHADTSNTYQGAIDIMKMLVKGRTTLIPDDPAPPDTPEIPELKPVEKRCANVT